MGTVPLALLFTAHRSGTPLVEIFSRAFDPRRAPRFSRYLLLLSQSLLPRFLLGSPCLRRWRIPSAQLSRRDRFSVHPAKCPSLLFLSGRSFHRLPLARRDSLVLFRRSFWDRRRHARPDNQC